MPALSELLRSPHAKLALAAGFAFVPILALQALNGPGGLSAAVRPSLLAVHDTVRLMSGGATEEDIAAARATQAAVDADVFTGNLFGQVAAEARRRGAPEPQREELRMEPRR